MGGRKLNKRQKKQVKRLIGNVQEVKFDITSIATTGVISTTPIIEGHTLPPQNVTDGGRIGDEIYLKSFEYKLMVQKDGASANASDVLRVIVFQWKPNSTVLAPTAAQILLTDPITTAVNVRSYFQQDYKDQYRILSDRVWKMTGTYNVGTGAFNESCNQYHHVRVPLKKAHKSVQFTAATNAGANRLYILLIGNIASGSAPPTYQLVSHTRFTDS